MTVKKKIVDIVVAAAFILAAVAGIFNFFRDLGYANATADCRIMFEQAPDIFEPWVQALASFC